MEYRRRVSEPKPSASEQRALERLLSGQGNSIDAEAIRLLVGQCGKYGCVYTRLSKASPGMKECPGWCRALEVYDAQCKARDAAKTGNAESKTGKLARDEQAALRAFEEENLSTKDVLVLMLLSKKCARGGCANSNDTDIPCPGWCGIAHDAWDRWWS
ncbi:hypothetical protein [Adlercreutzia sp. ZJ141]|uniref:hypothetical protein n=1 Tax=Adlercreutzia sp. ZJ141 TaxID=2709406 RepID=UPI0013EC706D|nr:hypothetical protein [Adlercreutzia sp. ZJ141]